MEKIGRTKIVDLLKRTDIGAMVNVKGWVRTRRGSKQVNFIALNDGSTINFFCTVPLPPLRLTTSTLSSFDGVLKANVIVAGSLT